MLVVGGSEDFGRSNSIYRLSLPTHHFEQRVCLQDDYSVLLELEESCLEQTYDLMLMFSCGIVLKSYMALFQRPDFMKMTANNTKAGNKF
jgi:hypothetical protein